MSFRDEKALEHLGTRIKRVQDNVLEKDASERLEFGYRGFLSRIDRKHSHGRWRAGFRWATGFAVAATAAFALWWMQPDKPTTLSFTVGHERTAGVVGGWITAPSSKSIPVVFSDGTRVDLKPDARARIGLDNAKAGRVVLESGSARVHVIHREHVQWKVDAGPFVVRVTGTRFDVSWDPELQLFEVSLREGAVVTAGPVLNKGQTVAKGQTLRVSIPRAMALLADTNSLPSIREWIGHSQAEPKQEGKADRKANRERRTEVATKRADTLDARWKELADRGQYEAALASAEHQGFAKLCRSLGAAALIRLAEVARFAGRVDRAEQALLALRERFPKRGEAAVAAYTLGLSAFDQKGDYKEARKWFEVYLRQQPSGPLAREALGRLMEAQYRQGQKEKAKDTARRYIERFPNGPHADIAARLVAE